MCYVNVFIGKILALIKPFFIKYALCLHKMYLNAKLLLDPIMLKAMFY